MRQVTWCGVCDEVGSAAYRASNTTRHMVAPGGRGGVKHVYGAFYLRLIEYS